MHKRRSPARIRMTRADIVTRALCQLICLFFLLVFTLPIAYVLISSVCYRGVWSLDGYGLLIKNDMVITGLINSLILCGVGTVYSLALEIPAAYVLAKKERQRMTTWFMLLGSLGLPILPLYLLLKQMGLLNTLWALILPCAVSVHNTNILRARMINISGELEDAAAVDGAGTLTYIWRIMMPILGPTLGCVAFFHISGFWSSTLYAQTFLTEEARYPLSVVLMELLIRNRSADVLGAGASLTSVAATQMAEFALCVLSTLPLVLIFLMLKKHIRTIETDGSTVQ